MSETSFELLLLMPKLHFDLEELEKLLHHFGSRCFQHVAVLRFGSQIPAVEHKVLILQTVFVFKGPKKSAAKKEPKDKRESNEESKENLKAKSDDSGEEKNGDDDPQKNGPKKKGQILKNQRKL